MLCKTRKGIDKDAIALKSSPNVSRAPRYLSQEKFEKLEVQPFFEPTNKLSIKQSPLKLQRARLSSSKIASKSKLKSISDGGEDESFINLTEKKEDNRQRLMNQEQTAQQQVNNVRIHSKLTEKFPNICDYVTSQSIPSSQISHNKKKIKNLPLRKRNYNELVPEERKYYTYNSDRLKALKDIHGRRVYYEGRIELCNHYSSKSRFFRVFTDIDLGINAKNQKTLQETYLDDDCQTDSDQIKLAINKSKSQVQQSLKRIKREQLIYNLINGGTQEEKESSSYFSSQSSYKSKSSSPSYRFKFSKESGFL